MNTQTIVTIICAVIASSGFWAFITKLGEKRDVRTKYITQSEYENLYKYLYEPYKKMGGNGSAERVMEEVKRLEIRPDTYSL